MIAFFEKLGWDMLRASGEHLYLTSVALAIAIAIAVPLAICLTRTRRQWLTSGVMGGASVVQTVPTLALISMIVVVFKYASLPTIGVAPALVALVLYALLPILRNTYTGIRQVDPSVKEVATGMGMTPRQVLLSVELPLSLPVMMAGIRIATVWTIGIATLCGLVGAGGLGDLIIRGLRSYHMDEILAGSLPAAVMALLANWGLGWLERRLTSEGLRIEVSASE